MLVHGSEKGLGIDLNRPGQKAVKGKAGKRRDDP